MPSRDFNPRWPPLWSDHESGVTRQKSDKCPLTLHLVSLLSLFPFPLQRPPPRAGGDADDVSRSGIEIETRARDDTRGARE